MILLLRIKSHSHTQDAKSTHELKQMLSHVLFDIKPSGMAQPET